MPPEIGRSARARTAGFLLAPPAAESGKDRVLAREFPIAVFSATRIVV